jgi:hypothetical protein
MDTMRSALLTATIALAIVFAPSALAAGNGPTKSVYDHKAKQVQKVVAAVVTKKQPTAKPKPKPAPTKVVVTKQTLPFTGLDLTFLAGAGIVLVAMGVSLRRITRKSDLTG